jgi:hypothetical protein
MKLSVRSLAGTMGYRKGFEKFQRASEPLFLWLILGFGIEPALRNGVLATARCHAGGSHMVNAYL